MSATSAEMTDTLSTAGEAELTPAEQAASQPFVGRWNRLISTTNWEKGAIIVQWRETVMAASGPVTSYSDEAWSRLVGSVTPQHVGRLRRVQQRFGAEQKTYKGLYWSHFFAALDWTDAEMWLQGAVENSWSVSQMRNQRWDTLGRVGAAPQAVDEVSSELDEDAETSGAVAGTISGSYDELPGPRHEGPDFGDEESSSLNRRGEDRESTEALPAVDLIRPFADLPSLPDDLAEALDGLKLALLRHKTDGWRDASCSDVLAWLDAFKALATAPTSETAPF